LKALILAGGYATRLRPISYTLPKLLFPILGKPMIYWTLDLLESIGITEVVLAVNYLAEALRSRVGSTHRGMQIKYSLESQVLGTAGPIKLALSETHLNETFIAMNGDVIAEIGLHDMAKQHHQSNALITDALHEVKDPSRFGVVKMDAGKRIQLFVEKPKPSAAPSRLVNAGIYVIEPEVLRLIPENRKVSLEREVFPNLATVGRLFGYEFSGYWFDIGNFADFRTANFSLLRSSAYHQENANATIATNAVLRKLVRFGENSRIDNGAHVGPNVVLGDDVSIGKNAEVKESILFDRITVGNGAKIHGAIIPSDVKIGKGVRIGRDCIVSSHVNIADQTKIAQGAIVHPHKEVTQNVRAREHVM